MFDDRWIYSRLFNPAQMTVIITYEIPLNEVDAVLARGKTDIERRLMAARDDILGAVEDEQIKSYTGSNNPAPPPGSRYQRTFTLQAASETEAISNKLPVISGIWRVNEGQARYGRYVLGSRAEQARIHRGRWKSRTDVEQAIKIKAPAIVEEHLK
jgi:hypothetical protein